MQPIATRSPFGNLPQSLTSLSDKISSWSGLGSSLLNLYHNLRFPATLSNAIITVLYFSTLSGLGISSSFLFNVPAVNETIVSTMRTRIGAPSLSGLVPPGSYMSSMPINFSNFTFDWYRSGLGVGMLSSDNTTTYSGISGNRIYDTLLLPTSTSNSSAIVGYTDFNVKCGGVPEVSAAASMLDSQFITTSTAIFDSNTMRNMTLLTFNYTLGSSTISSHDLLSITENFPTYYNFSGGVVSAVSRLWQPAGRRVFYFRGLF